MVGWNEVEIDRLWIIGRVRPCVEPHNRWPDPGILRRHTTTAVAEFIDDRHLLVIGQGGRALVMTIDVPELTEVARSRVTRGLTPKECTTYHLDPCPTLEQIRSNA